MKKVLFLLISITLIFSSCQKEDDNNPNNGSNNTSGSILGIWEASDWTYQTDEFDIDTITGTKTLINSYGSTIIYLPNQAFWTFTNDGLLNCQEMGSNGETETWSFLKSGNTLLLESTEGEYRFLNCTITTLDNNNLSLWWETSYNVGSGLVIETHNVTNLTK